MVLPIDGTLMVAFAQRRIGTAGYRSMVVLHLSREAASRFAVSCLGFVATSLAELRRQQSALVDLLENIVEPEQTVAMDVNLIAAAHTGLEACLDFYMISPWATLAMRGKKNGEIGVDPVLRVTLSLGLLLTVIKETASLVAVQLPFEAENA